MTTVRLGIAAAAACILWQAGTAAGNCSAVRPEMCRDAVARIEEAYRAGQAAARKPEERLECLRLRTAGLAVLSERTYEAALAAAAGKPRTLLALQRHQAAWQAMMDGLRLRTEEEWEGAGELYLERLRTFARIMPGDTGTASVFFE